MIWLHGSTLISEIQLRFMQLSTQPFIANTWVVTRSDSQVLVFTAYYRSVCNCNAEF